MARVTMVTLSAGPAGVFHPGAIRELPEAQARELVAARSAVWTDAKRRESAVVAAAENAAAATKPPAPRRGQ